MTKKTQKTTAYKTYSLDKNRVDSLKQVMSLYEISYRGDADAIHKAIDKYIVDFKLIYPINIKS